jgi:ribosomal protein S18 acetylase RimI-like enzyme
MKKKLNIKIVLATPEDATGIQEVFYKTWLDTYPNEECGITVDDIEYRYKDHFTDEALKKRAEKIANMPKDQTFLLAKDKDKVVGVSRVVRHKDNNELQAIYVLPEYQGKGIGKLFWEEAKKHFDINKSIIVVVASYNNKAIDFYKKLGFKDTGKRFEYEKFRFKSGAIIPMMEMVKS